MRLTSDFWTAAFIRSVRQAGGFAYLARRGAEEAGAIFIRQTLSDVAQGALSGQIALYGPAPQVFYGAEEGRPPLLGDRLFMRLAAGSAAEIEQRLAQELNFDPDIWIIETENFADLSAADNLRLIAAGEADSGKTNL